jgi:hypothetical protein
MQQSTIVEQHCFDYACSGVPERKQGAKSATSGEVDGAKCGGKVVAR